MTDRFEVIQRGFDSSGRPNRATRWMWATLDAVKKHPLIAPFAWKIVVVQNGFMRGSGASASDGFHDFAGCVDLRTWNLTTSEIDKLVWVGRAYYGLGGWRRDLTARHGGMAQHYHATLGSDSPLSPGARISWSSYLNGGDGLAGAGGDYERRPSPLVLAPPVTILAESWLMASEADEIKAMLRGLSNDLNTFRQNEADRDAKEALRDREAAKKARATTTRLIGKLGGIADTLVELENKVANESDEIKALVKRTREQLLTVLSEEPNVDGADNPA